MNFYITDAAHRSVNALVQVCLGTLLAWKNLYLNYSLHCPHRSELQIQLPLVSGVKLYHWVSVVFNIHKPVELLLKIASCYAQVATTR